MSSQDDDPATMSIGEVARRTGVTVPTLRAWERRYGLLVPVRTAGGHRRYREEDVRRVLAVLELTGQGWAVGAAARQVAGQSSAASVARPVDELRDRLWSALEQALRDLPAETEAAGPPGESPTTGQAEASAGALPASGSSGTSVRTATVRQRRPTAAAAGQPELGAAGDGPPGDPGVAVHHQRPRGHRDPRRRRAPAGRLDHPRRSG